MKTILNPGRIPGVFLPSLAALAAFGLVSCLQPADEIATKNSSRIVFVKEASVGQNNSVAMAANPDEFHPGSDLYLLSPISPSGELTNLTKDWTRDAADHDRWGAAADPEVSVDGQKIVFSMRKALASSWLLYELDLGTGALTQLTDVPNDCITAQTERECNDIDPAYLDETHIVFGSTRNRIEDEYERRLVPQLFVGELGGPGGRLKNIRQITFNQSHDQNPFLHSSGKIYFTRWDHLGDPNKMPLFTVNPDGSGQFVLYGADETFSSGMTSGQRTFMEARELSDGGIVTSMMERTSRFEGGAIAIVDVSRFTAPPQILTPDAPYNNTNRHSDGLYKTPYPIDDGGTERILVAKSGQPAGGDVKVPKVNFDLFVMDKNGKNLKLVHADPNYNDYDPVVVAPRRFSFSYDRFMNKYVRQGLEANAKTGVFFTANVYSRMNDNHMKPDAKYVNSDGSVGQAKYLRVLEAVSMPDYGMRGGNLGRTEFEKQRVLGYADIRGDGSFSIEVPANRPLHVQTLDENGMMLVNQLQWINVMPGERRVCTGCHGPRDQDANINFIKGDTLTDGTHTEGVVRNLLDTTLHYLSTFNNAQDVAAHPAARTDTVDFYDIQTYAYNKKYGSAPRQYKANTVQAVLDSRCVQCHSAAAAADSGGHLVLENIPNAVLNDSQRISSAYRALTRDSAFISAKPGTTMAYANSDGARNSPLAWILFNKQLGRTNETLFTPKTGMGDHSTLWAKDAHGHIDPFNAANSDLLRIIEWMDMGLQFSNTVGWTYEKP